jgi:hypothetical protein
MGCRVSEAGYLRAAFSWYPTLIVRMDGKRVTPQRSLLGAMIIACTPGEHTIEIVPATSDRMRSWLCALAGALVIVSSLATTSRRSKKAPRKERAATLR